MEERDRHRRAHAGGALVVDRPLVDATVRLLDQLGDAPLAVPVVVALAALLQCRGGERGGDLAGLRPAHPVGDREQRRVADVRVFVAAPLPPGVRLPYTLTDLHVSNRRSVSPMRTTSPGTSRRSRLTRI